jgi:hypothetical protein
VRRIAALVVLLSLAAVVASAAPGAIELGGGASSGATRSAKAATATTTIYVDPKGSDLNAGSSPTAPMRTIQNALKKATPGTTIQLAPGAYHETIHTVANGTASAPITIQGPETGMDVSKRHVATLYGTGRIVNVDHSYLTLRGFTIDGEEALRSTPFPTTLDQATAFKDSVQAKTVDSTMVFVGSADTTRNVTGTTLDDMYLHAAGGDCVRIRNASTNTTITRSTIDWCGMWGKDAGAGVFTYHNGEGVYVGTSPKSTDQPMAANDSSSGTILDHDTIATYGSECLDVKENAHDNVLRYSTCADNTEPLSDYGSNVELRGFANTLLGDTITGSLGYGVKISTDGPAWDKGGNSVRQTAFSNAAGAFLRVTTTSAQGLFCGDTFSTTLVLDGTAVGVPTAACPS